MDTYNVLILADSRLRDFNNYLSFAIQQEKLPVEVEIKVVRGGQLDHMKELGLSVLENESYHLVLVAAGVNDLTILNKRTRNVSPVFDDLGHLVDTITDRLHDVKNSLMACTQYLIICQIPGMDMNTFNKGRTEHYLLQDVINGGIRYVNRVVCSINEENAMIPPWIFSDIHVYDKKQQKYIDKYVKFSDGLHPDDLLLMRWAEAFAKCIQINLRNCYNL